MGTNGSQGTATEEAMIKQLLIEVNEAANDIEKRIQLDDPAETERLKKMFRQCFLNTAETTVTYPSEDSAYIITGDIHAMWLRDSSAQVIHYLPFADKYPAIKKLISSLIRRQCDQILTDAYTNAFMENSDCVSKYHDVTDASPITWERKYELDSLCYPVWLMWNYYQNTDDNALFDTKVRKTLYRIMEVIAIEQDHMNASNYRFQRMGRRATDTLTNEGMGEPVEITGMSWCGFRPSDDACTYGYLIPSNMFAVRILEYISKLADEVYGDSEMKRRAMILGDSIKNGIKENAVTRHWKYGEIYAYETDGRGNYNLMDDANVPSLLSLPWMGVCSKDDPIYLNTRRFILSPDNPYYFSGKYAEGIGSPHTLKGYVWPIALIMQGLTTDDREEKMKMLKFLCSTDAGTCFMHESFDVNSPDQFSRSWFAWANSLFAAYIADLF